MNLSLIVSSCHVPSFTAEESAGDSLDHHIWNTEGIQVASQATPGRVPANKD
jgi:hypothetical protein